jgi:hypothetical protein
VPRKKTGRKSGRKKTGGRKRSRRR